VLGETRPYKEIGKNETSSVTLMAENKLMDFRKNLLRREAQSKKPETGKEFHNL
jgi:hypothetical protein